MPRPTIVRAVLAGLLAGSAVLFIFATSAERHKEHAEQRTEAAGHAEAPSPTSRIIAPQPPSTEPTTTVTSAPPANASGDADRGNEHSVAAATVPTTTAPPAASDHDIDQTPATSPPATAGSQTVAEHADADQHGGRANAEKAEMLFGVKTESTTTTAVAVALSLVAAGVALGVRRRRWLWPIVAFASALAVLDGREAAHQANIGRGGLETLAIILTVAHAAAAVVAVLATTGRRLEPAGGR